MLRFSIDEDAEAMMISDWIKRDDDCHQTALMQQ